MMTITTSLIPDQTSGNTSPPAAPPAAFRQDAERFRRLVENSLDLVVEVDFEGRSQYVSPNITAVLGYAVGELIGTSVFDRVHPEDLARAQAQFALPEGRVTCRYRHKDGSWRWLETTGRDFVTDTCDKRSVLIARDVTARVEAEEALRRSEERMRLILENTLDAVVTISAEGIITGWNPQAETTFGWKRSEVVGRRMSEVLIPENHHRAYEEGLIRLQTSGPDHALKRRLELTALRRDGRQIPVELAITPVRTADGMAFCGFIRDLSSLREAQRHQTELEAHVCRSQKLESLGTLAGGIAHDFNNILGAIMAYTELARTETDGWTDVQSHLNQVLKACDRAKDLVRQILTFSRQQRTPHAPVKLQSLVAEVLKLLRSTLPRTIEMTSKISAETGLVLADSSQIHQVLVNLCTNAAHAMRGRSGKLDVSLAPFTVDEAFARSQPGLRPGPCARLSVSDTGHGMDASTLSRIFEPFFTTKGMGEGTGLGLAVVHGIISNHHGAIQVHSRSGHGSTFHIYLPVHETSTDGAELPTAVFSRGQQQRVLFVDDEPALGLAVKKLLQRMNYAVTVSSDPEEALRTFRARPDAVDLVIADMQMPGLTGAAFAEQLLKIRPGLPVLLSTGFPDEWTVADVQRLGVRDLLMKPICPNVLSQTLAGLFAPPDQAAVKRA